MTDSGSAARWVTLWNLHVRT